MVNKNKKVRVWHCRFGHASNAKIIRASNFFTGIRNFNNAYDLIEVYSYLEQFGLNNNDDYIENQKELAKVGRHPNNKPKSANPEKRVITKV